MIHIRNKSSGVRTYNHFEAKEDIQYGMSLNLYLKDKTVFFGVQVDI